MHLSRVLFAAATLVALSVGLTAKAAEDPPWRHGTALLGTIKYPADFKHFDYVNPNAPKGGTLRLATDGTFDSFNFLIPRGNSAQGLGLIYETLMTAAYDEVASEYGLVAEGVRYPADYAWVSYRLRPEARWHDGTPISPEDVIWSFEQAKKLNPRQRFYYQHVVKAEKTGDREVTFTFDQPGNRELPQIVGQFQILPKHWWEGTGPDGRPRDISETTLEPPLGSGPYRVKRVEPGRLLVYERVKDYWGNQLPVHIGTNNFDEISYEYYLDDTIELEAFKGDRYDVRLENSAKNWATAYDFPAVRDGRVILQKFEDRSYGVMQGFVPNIRRAKFADWRVRRALDLAFNFEETNRTAFFDQYERPTSFFHGTELAARGLPEGRELEILKEAQAAGPIPETVFTTPYTNPTAPDPNAYRANLRKAFELLAEAGWKPSNEGGGRLLMRNAQGEPFEFELLTFSPAFERVAVRYREQLARLGINMRIRVVDSSQYQNRVRARDYDVLITGWTQSLSPGNEQADYWGSAAADLPGSNNFVGIKDKAIDALIAKVIFAKDRDELVAASRALDRVLLAHHFVIPGWTLKATRMARWDRFSFPEKLPEYNPTGFPTIWWYDEAKAKKTGGRS